MHPWGPLCLGEKMVPVRYPQKDQRGEPERVCFWNLPSENEDQLKETQGQRNYVPVYIIILTVCLLCIPFRQPMVCVILGLCAL